VATIGFKPESKDESNTHFIKFEFTKTNRKGNVDWSAVEKRGKILKPCEYKRR